MGFSLSLAMSMSYTPSKIHILKKDISALVNDLSIHPSTVRADGFADFLFFLSKFQRFTHNS